jgi:hypothetical protein
MNNANRLVEAKWPLTVVGKRRACTIPTPLACITPLAQPRIAALVALILYLLRASLSPTGFQRTSNAYFNYLADAFLHGQLHFRLPTSNVIDLVFHQDHVYLYSPPFPAILLMPLVQLFGIGVSDVLYTAVLAGLSIGLLAKLLMVLDQHEIAPLSVERRAILVTTMAFGSVILILAPVGWVSFTAQITGWNCVLLATIAALTQQGKRGYFLVGLSLACALATRNGLLFNGVWLAFYMLHRDRHYPLRQRIVASICGLAPVITAILLLAAYNLARFGHPLDAGLLWHRMNPIFQADFDRYSAFDLHYLPTNLYYQFLAYPLFTTQQWNGGGIFWMTPVLLGAPYAIWKERKSALTYALVVSCLLAYIPIGLLMGTGYLTFGPRYLLDLMVPIVVLTAIGIRRWNLTLLQLLMLISCLTYLLGSLLWSLFVYT